MINETQNLDDPQPQLDVLAVKNGSHFCVFVDFRAAFDSIDRAKLIKKLLDMNFIDAKWIHFVDAMHIGMYGPRW